MNDPLHWSLDTSEVDRLLDGELPERERVERHAEVAADPVVAERVEVRRAFLAALARAAPTAGRGPRDASLAELERRVRTALARDRARTAAVPRRTRIPAWSWAAAAAAVLVLGLGLLQFGPSLRPADATPPEALLAADLVRTAPGTADGGATCGVQEATSPFRLRLVERREMAVKRCIDAEDEPSGAPEQALLYRVADLDLVGYVAVPDRGAKLASEIGVTRLDDVVVFDVRQGGALYWLAVKREVVDRRGSCAACHGRSREGEKNPHRFRERRGPAPRS